jgi:hypothetical protein
VGRGRGGCRGGVGRWGGRRVCEGDGRWGRGRSRGAGARELPGAAEEHGAGAIDLFLRDANCTRLAQMAGRVPAADRTQSSLKALRQGTQLVGLTLERFIRQPEPFCSAWMAEPPFPMMEPQDLTPRPVTAFSPGSSVWRITNEVYRGRMRRTLRPVGGRTAAGWGTPRWPRSGRRPPRRGPHCRALSLHGF